MGKNNWSMFCGTREIHKVGKWGVYKEKNSECLYGKYQNITEKQKKLI